MQQPFDRHAISCHLAKIVFFIGVIAISRFSGILLDGLSTTAGHGLHRLTQELWMFCS